jgi:glycosyltransferase involved in cell wall biosynthesis
VQIAVVVPAFNVAPYLRRALDSMLRQTHTDWSLVVIDDGSTDATAAVAAAFTDPRIRLIRQGNAGVSAARNRGVAAFLDGRIGFPGADSTYCDDTRLPRAQTADAFLFLDGDDFLAPDALVCLAETLEGAPWAVAACGRYARVAADGATYRPGCGCAAAQRMLAGSAVNPQPVREWGASADPPRSDRGCWPVSPESLLR